MKAYEFGRVEWGRYQANYSTTVYAESEEEAREQLDMVDWFCHQESLEPDDSDIDLEQVRDLDAAELKDMVK